MDDPIWVRETRTPEEADEICVRLRSAGIRCNYLQMPSLTSATAWLGTFLASNQCWYVFVDATDADRARDELEGRNATT